MSHHLQQVRRGLALAEALLNDYEGTKLGHVFVESDDPKGDMLAAADFIDHMAGAVEQTVPLPNPKLPVS